MCDYNFLAMKLLSLFYTLIHLAEYISYYLTNGGSAFIISGIKVWFKACRLFRVSRALSSSIAANWLFFYASIGSNIVKFGV